MRNSAVQDYFLSSKKTLFMIKKHVSRSILGNFLEKAIYGKITYKNILNIQLKVICLLIKLIFFFVFPEQVIC